MLTLALLILVQSVPASGPARPAPSAPAQGQGPALSASDFVLIPLPIPAIGEPDAEVEKELDAMFQEDRIERSSVGSGGPDAARRLKVNAANRTARVDQLWIEGKLVAPRVRMVAASLYQFGPGLEELLRAHALARSAALSGLAEARMLAATSEDVVLLRQRKAQRWGTQYVYANDRIRLAPVDGSVTDAQRARWNVPSLEVLRDYEKKWAHDRDAAASRPGTAPASKPAGAKTP